LIKVESFVNKGYGMNKRYDIDDDMGLLFLSSCATIVPGVVETIKVATLDIEPLPGSGTCVTAESIGFGRITNLPSQIAYTDGKLRSIPDIVHNFDTCLKSYIGDTLILDGYDSSYLDKAGNEKVKAFFQSFLVPELHSCMGGNSVHSSCNGDSGGPITATKNGQNFLIGLTSFGISDYCGYGADYIARVAPWATYIRDKILANNKQCSGWDISKSFASYPPPALGQLSNLYSSSRCLSQWQCGDGTCIDLSRVCDKSQNCPDGSDEESSFCSYQYAVGKSVRASMKDIDTETQLKNQAELEALIAANSQLISEGGRRLAEAEQVVVVVGTLTSVGRARPTIPEDIQAELDKVLSSGSGVSTDATADPSIPSSEGNIRSSIYTKATSTNCATIVSSTTALIQNEQANGYNRAEQDPTNVQAACDAYESCVDQGSIASSSTLSSFCTSFDTFVTKRAQALASVSRFDSAYGNTCPAPAFLAQTVTSDTTGGGSTGGDDTDITKPSPPGISGSSTSLHYTYLIASLALAALIH
jgi:hypothetical protein